MSDRNTDDIGKLPLDEESDKLLSSSNAQKTEVENKKAKGEKALEEEVHLHFPQPTPLSSILLDVAKWSELNFVMDPALNRPIQIFAPRRMNKKEAFHVFVASLETIGLRALHLQGSVVKIVPIHIGKIAV